MYYRFNTPTGTDAIGLAEYTRMNTLRDYTTKYLATEDIKAQIKEVAALLVGE
jgi:hypothetical protein